MDDGGQKNNSKPGRSSNTTTPVFLARRQRRDGNANELQKKYMVCLQKKKFSCNIYFSRTFLSSNCVSFKTNKTFNVTDCVQVGHAQIIGHFWWQNLFESQRPTIQQESEKNNSICRRPD